MTMFFVNQVETDDDSDLFEVITRGEERIATHSDESVCHQLADRLNGTVNGWEYENPGCMLADKDD